MEEVIPDHGHLMHRLSSAPGTGRMWHCIPIESLGDASREELPSMPAGDANLRGHCR